MRPRDTTERENRRIQRTAVVHCAASAVGIRAAVGTTATQRTVRNRLLLGQLRARRLVACIPLTLSHCRLHIGHTPRVKVWRVIYYDSRSTLGGYPKHGDRKFAFQSGNSTFSTAIHEQRSRGSFQQDKVHPRITAAMKRVLQSVDMLP
ncbi:HTH_Tnp_Tc3_2 domain-containing protein [Trichonephila clavipes]|nr:HTH_Tnp_Tc3_2 domain-containing protein [Trichonephila clavipes]